MSYREFFKKLKKSLNRGRRLYLVNYSGDELEITNEMSDALLEWSFSTDGEEFKRQMKIRDAQISNLIDEIVDVKKELHKVRGMKSALNDKKLRYQLFMSSKEGKVIERLMKQNIDDPDLEPHRKQYDEIKNTRIEEDDHIMSSDKEDKLRQEYKDKYKGEQ